MTLPRPSVEEVQQALLCVASTEGRPEMDRTLTQMLLPYTKPDAAWFALLAIRSEWEHGQRDNAEMLAMETAQRDRGVPV